MKFKTSSMTRIAVALVFISVFANALAAYPPATDFFPLLMWIHLVVVVLGIWAVLRIWKLKSTWSEVVSVFLPVPIKILALGILVVVITAVYGKNLNFELGNLQDGTAVHSKSWSESEGKYWLSVNKKPAAEITKSQYQELQRESYGIFALGWLIFSYLIVLQCYYISRIEVSRGRSASV